MGDELTRRAGRYWVLFFQPLPEEGERIAIALVFEEDGRSIVEFDPSFAKITRMYPDADPAGLAFYLNSLRTELATSSRIEAVLHTYGPQISASPARRINVPVKRSVIDTLMTRYIYPARRVRRAEREPDPVGREIEAFVRNNVGPSLGWQRDVAARDILGRSIAGAKRVAVAIPNQAGWTLVDGVDLNQLSPREAAARADEISRTFWNYSRCAGGAGLQIDRVGIVLNGNSQSAPKTHEAHDYALHRFEVDSDLAIDAASNESGELLRKLIARAGRR